MRGEDGGFQHRILKMQKQIDHLEQTLENIYQATYPGSNLDRLERTTLLWIVRNTQSMAQSGTAYATGHRGAEEDR